MTTTTHRLISLLAATGLAASTAIAQAPHAPEERPAVPAAGLVITKAMAEPAPGDQRRLITQVKGKTRAVLYRARVPGTAAPEPQLKGQTIVVPVERHNFRLMVVEEKK